MSKQRFINAERGVSLSGLIVVLAVIGVLAVLALKIAPGFIEYRAIKNGIVAAKAAGGTVAEMQRSFDKNADINNVTTITGRDLAFSRDTGETEISFRYEQRIPLVGNATLLLDYAGSTDKNGVVADKAASTAQAR